MRSVEWSSKAERQLASWIRRLARAAGAEIAMRASDDARRAADRLGRFSGYRASWWDGYQHVGLRDWHKLLVYRLEGERVIVAALYDMRQDLTRVQP